MKTILVSLRMLLLLTGLTGVMYPLMVTGLAHLLWPVPAKGSLVIQEGSPVGSALLAQAFTGDRYFWPRPSAAGYATVASGASNLAPSNGQLRDIVTGRAQAFRAAHAGVHPV